MAQRSVSDSMAILTIAALGLSSCSSDGLIPPEEIDGGTRVGSISSMRQPIGRVGQPIGRVGDPIGRVEEPSGYVQDAPEAPGGLADADYLDTPNLADTGTAAPVSSAPLETVAAVPDSAPDESGPSQSAAGQMIVPEEGINIDNEVMGTAEGPDLLADEPKPVAQPAPADGPMAIAEGSTSQPVVDGIGTDEPVSVTPPGQAVQ
ncbi:hypothetical protein HFC70_14825 [Agrobacterium sp. a22-2]|uniref:hypothetical protein n=1 Tax=Agrobacterium sp. a22-2 TaxID=2283840 RepID=UPI0014483DBA|nr:hypothetical protein [Agrobacterium sp. a22-2]NKN37624.1 hypothetical protein [Agrobacterium sp. a22-2]